MSSRDPIQSPYQADPADRGASVPGSPTADGSSRPRGTSFRPATVWVVGGLVVALASLAGDLVMHALHPEAAEPALAGPGLALWHLGLFGGLVTAGLGAGVAAATSGARGGRVLAVVVVGLSVVAVGGGVAQQLGIGPSARPRQAAMGHSAPEGAAGSGSGVPSTDTHAPQSDDHRRAGTGTAPWKAKNLARQLEAARRATARYRDVGEARADGYIQVTQFIPELGLHMADPAALVRPFDPARPPVLLYEPSGPGRLSLVGVAYAVAGGSEQPEGFPGEADHWHVHHDLCFLPNGTVRGDASAAACAAEGGFFQERTPWLLHAWIWKPNPLGIFVEANPLV